MLEPDLFPFQIIDYDTHDGIDVTITWDNEGYEYKIYSCDDPFGTFELEETVIDTNQVILLAPVGTKKFYKVTAE